LQQDAVHQETPYQEDPYQEDPYPEAPYREAPAPDVASQLPTRRRSPEAVRDRLTGFQLGSRDATRGSLFQGATQYEAPTQETQQPEVAQPGQLPTRRRSPEAVRDRLTGFQLGSQDALMAGPEHRQTPPAEEENSR
jgi:hypothetical protein